MPTTIYHLVDPRDGAVRYVGKTRRTVAERLGGHIRAARSRRGFAPCRRWIGELLALGLRPVAVPVATVADGRAKQAEFEAIGAARDAGAALTNVMRW